MANMVQVTIYATNKLSVAGRVIESLYYHGMNHFRPCPKAFYDKELFPDQPWYTWCVEHWGTKWDLYSEYRKLTRDGKQLEAITANSAPFEFMEYLAELYPGIEWVMVTSYEENSFETEDIYVFKK